MNGSREMCRPLGPVEKADHSRYAANDIHTAQEAGQPGRTTRRLPRHLGRQVGNDLRGKTGPVMAHPTVCGKVAHITGWLDRGEAGATKTAGIR